MNKIPFQNNNDGFLTDERLARWALMLNTANTI